MSVAVQDGPHGEKRGVLTLRAASRRGRRQRTPISILIGALLGLTLGMAVSGGLQFLVGSGWRVLVSMLPFAMILYGGVIWGRRFGRMTTGGVNEVGLSGVLDQAGRPLRMQLYADAYEELRRAQRTAQTGGRDLLIRYVTASGLCEFRASQITGMAVTR